MEGSRHIDQTTVKVPYSQNEIHKTKPSFVATPTNSHSHFSNTPQNGYRLFGQEADRQALEIQTQNTLGIVRRAMMQHS